MIIGLSGKKQCGKNTVSLIIQALSQIDGINTDSMYRYGEVKYEEDIISEVKRIMNLPTGIVNKWEEKSFAYKLRECLYTLTGNSKVFNLDEASKKSPSGIKSWAGREYAIRELLQLFGTEVGRVISPNIWVDCLLKDYKNINNWIITDVRFENEAEAIKALGGVVIRIDRNLGAKDNHVSETALDSFNGFDATIDNNGTIEDLINNTLDVVKKLNLITVWE